MPDPIPLNLDWDSPEGKRHQDQMSKLPWDNPVAVAHFKNIGKLHPAAPQAEVGVAVDTVEKKGE